METVRFSQVVAKCGEPKAHAQWVPLAKDAELKEAVEDERVMTVHILTVGNKKDFGEIGLATEGQRTLLIFPKSLRRFAGKRVVGIDYGLLKADPVEEEEVEEVKAERVKAEAVKKSKVKTESKVRAEPKVETEPKSKLKLVPKPVVKKKPERKPKLKLVKKPVVKVRAVRPPKVEKVSAKKAAVKAAKVKEVPKKKSAGEADLKAVIRKAMKQLSQGKDVAAYQTLLGGL